MAQENATGVNVLYINNLPTEDEGHPLEWSYAMHRVMNRPVIILKTSFGSWDTVAHWDSGENMTIVINDLLGQKRSAWRKKLLAEGSVTLLPSPEGPSSVYNYLGEGYVPTN